VVFCVALLASLSVHLPVYEVLGGLAKKLLADDEAKQKKTPVEFELTALDDDTVKAAEPNKPAELKPEPLPPSPSAKPKEEPEPPKVEEKKAEAPKPKPKLNLDLTQPPPPPPPPPTPPPQEEPNKLAVTQKSDPNSPAPDHADFIAENNRTVEEQTVASVTNMQEDSDQTDLSASKSADDSALGNAAETEPADLRDERGETERNPDKAEAKTRPKEPSAASHGERNAPAVQAASQQGGAAGAQQEKRALAAGSETVGGEEEPLVIDDGLGTLRIRRSLAGHGPGNEGGDPKRGGAAQHPEHEGARAGKGANLKLSWSQFEQTFGSQELAEQRDAYLEQKRSRTRGGNREAEWKKFRSAIENFVPNVKPGNQTALNAAASPFAAYLAEVHRRIHREFAMRFIRDLPLVGGPYNDYSLFTKLEIVINGDGTLYRVGVVQSSGFLPYDYGAWNSVERAAPYPEPPRKILSGDGRVYFRWGFYRNERQCGTFNAEPYILPNAGAPAAPAPGPMHDSGESPDSKLGLRDGLPVTNPRSSLRLSAADTRSARR
jgi:outer membrane biosynthesis protein TonB